ncbi:conserved hypothetical protein [Xanthomonas oryzae pv. oryzae MAFF 311018]|nr:conserved hypothetical protein [Xanthomonas oryzae pv. oryzae MAFF 311018]
MDREALLLSEERVQVDYVFTNHSERDLSVPVAFPMPPMHFGMADHNALTDFKPWADGKPVATTRKLVVLLDDGSDISTAFAATGWTQDDVAAFTESSTPPKGRKPLPVRWVDGDGQPRLTLNAYFVWRQKCPARIRREQRSGGRGRRAQNRSGRVVHGVSSTGRARLAVSAVVLLAALRADARFEHPVRARTGINPTSSKRTRARRGVTCNVHHDRTRQRASVVLCKCSAADNAHRAQVRSCVGATLRCMQVRRLPASDNGRGGGITGRSAPGRDQASPINPNARRPIPARVSRLPAGAARCRRHRWRACRPSTRPGCDW